MMSRRTAVLASAAAAVPFFARAARADVVAPRDHTDADDVAQMLATSAVEWSRGDIDAFCSHYHDDAVFVSPSGLTKGRAAVLERYKKKYAGKAAMGALTLELLDVIASSTTASVAMRWKLAYPEKPAAEGFSVIGLVKPAKAWLIKHDASM